MREGRAAFSERTELLLRRTRAGAAADEARLVPWRTRVAAALRERERERERRTANADASCHATLDADEACCASPSPASSAPERVLDVTNLLWVAPDPAAGPRAALRQSTACRASAPDQRQHKQLRRRQYDERRRRLGIAQRTPTSAPPQHQHPPRVRDTPLTLEDLVDDDRPARRGRRRELESAEPQEELLDASCVAATSAATSGTTAVATQADLQATAPPPQQRGPAAADLDEEVAAVVAGLSRAATITPPQATPAPPHDDLAERDTQPSPTAPAPMAAAAAAPAAAPAAALLACEQRKEDTKKGEQVDEVADSFRAEPREEDEKGEGEGGSRGEAGSRWDDLERLERVVREQHAALLETWRKIG